ncbi:MAG: argininosuccinate lyase [Armatimonadota bacterium]|nr:argininosuccinate lyase [Armatimonadota bacterium]MDR7426793.1 argininosuccinate lyase [Armatimonadota bacterium]MDR7463930.1 argininosuccinate lyase [Armatimonadota bacterium]MDR7469883.1 argininosuccinate lyase [Armatimonadota bacterium]MDR7474343.1 argininosuccinate lyase [Armatimonadota bacterium]
MNEPGGHRMWGGRFQGRLHPHLARFTASLPVDIRLLPYDLRASLAHARMLLRQGIVPPQPGAQLVDALREMLLQAEAGSFPPDQQAEDVHTLIEAELFRRIGDAAGWLHTARSRNDQVVTAFRLWAKEAASSAVGAVVRVQDALLGLVERDGHLLLPAYTHLQRAQPALLGHHLLAYVWMLVRDGHRLRRAYEAADVLPLGSGAAVGVSFPVDRQAVARMLGFSRTSENSLDATSDRDFAVELLDALALLMTHLSRWAAEAVIWSTEEFGFLLLTDAVATGSSIMPQKRNPDAAELIRGRWGRVAGNRDALLGVLKGLPLGYQRDLQEDKLLVFEATDATMEALEALAVLLAEARFRPERMRAALDAGFVTATEVSDFLVGRGIPFRQAHNLAGQVVRHAEAQGKTLDDLTPEEWAALLPELDGAAVEQLRRAVTPEAAVQAKDVPGGTAPGQVRASAARAAAEVGRLRAWAAEAEAEEQRVREALRAPA